MISVMLDEEVAKDMLYTELKKWNLDYEDEDILSDYLDSLVDNGLLDGGEFTPSVIVDNIYVNDTRRVYRGDSDWKRFNVGKRNQDKRVLFVKDDVALISNWY